MSSSQGVSVVVCCHVAVDERNGGGMRTLIQYLSHLDYVAALSVHFGDTDDSGYHGLQNVGYEQLAKRRFPHSLLAYVWALRRIRRSTATEPTFILFPNTKDDVLLSLAATCVTGRTCVWLMDDFISTLTHAKTVRTAILDPLFRLLYRRAARRITVSAPMAREYTARYGKPADLILGKRWSRASLWAAPRRRDSVSASAPLRLVWVGKYQPYYDEPIVELSRLVRAHPDLPVALDLYGQGPPDAGVEVPGRVVYRGPFDDSGLLDILRRYDFGLLTYSFDERTRTFMRYSFPGKLIDYLSAGLPVITISPRDISICDEVMQRDIGPCIFAREPAEILEMLRAISGPEATDLARWRASALQWARTDFVLEDGIAAFRRTFGEWPPNG